MPLGPDYIGPLGRAINLSPQHLQSIGGNAAYIGSAGSATWPTADLLIAVPFRIGRPFLALAFLVPNGTTVTASTDVDVGVLTTRGKRLVSTGTYTQSGTSTNERKTTNCPFILAPGTYYLALVLHKATSHIFRWAPANIPLTAVMGVKQAALGSASIPDPVTLVTVANAYIPMVSLNGRAFA